MTTLETSTSQLIRRKKIKIKVRLMKIMHKGERESNREESKK